MNRYNRFRLTLSFDRETIEANSIQEARIKGDDSSAILIGQWSNIINRAHYINRPQDEGELVRQMEAIRKHFNNIMDTEISNIIK